MIMQRYLISPIIKDDPVVSHIHLKSQEEPLLSWKEVGNGSQANYRKLH